MASPVERLVRESALRFLPTLASTKQSKDQSFNLPFSSTRQRYSDMAILQINILNIQAKTIQLTRPFKLARAAEGIFATTTSRDKGANSNAGAKRRAKTLIFRNHPEMRVRFSALLAAPHPFNTATSSTSSCRAADAFHSLPPTTAASDTAPISHHL